MEKVEILNRVDAVCKALDNISVMGIQNAGNLAGCYAIPNEILLCRMKQSRMKERKRQSKNDCEVSRWGLSQSGFLSIESHVNNLDYGFLILMGIPMKLLPLPVQANYKLM